MHKGPILVLVLLLLLAVILGATLGVGNKCPEQVYVKVYKEDTDSYLLKDGVVEAVNGDEMTVEVLVRDSDVKTLLGPEITPTPCPTPAPEPGPTPVVTTSLTPTPLPTPTPQYTGVRKWVEDNRYVTSEDCTYGFLVKVVGQEFCAASVSYGHNIIMVAGQTFLDTGMVYVKTSVERYELVYISGLDNHFLTREEYVIFCIDANVNAGGTL